MAYTTINKPNQYFNTVLYAGNNGSSQSITGAGFKPDWVWIKNRTDARNHVLTDIVRGVTKTLFSQSTSAEVTNPTDGYLSSFDSDGFSVSQGSVNNENVCATDNYVSWNWLAANSTTTNTSGTITSTVSVNTTAGFSIVSYTGNGTANATVGHGLGVTPAFFVVKNRQDGTTNWNCYHKSLGKDLVVQLSTTSGQISVTDYWGTTGPTSTTIQLLNDGNINANGQTLICYAFAQIKGYSAFGSYTGNGSANGTFIYTGFKPAFILIKRSNSTADWYLQDNVRNQNFNGDPKTLQPNNANTEATIGTWSIDNLSNGFKIRESNAAVNASGGTYIYMAFAENPFVSATAIPTTAR